jgi:hypothetical protein
MENIFYAEWVPYENDDERAIGQTYLFLWKKFLLKKLAISYDFVSDQFIDRAPQINGTSGTLALKLEMKIKTEVV